MLSIILNGKEFRSYNHLYAVAEDGQVLRQNKLVKPVLRPDGYLALSKYLVHRMVATCWVPNPSDTKHVHHKDGVKTNNSASNLEWLLPKEHYTTRHKDTVGKHSCPEWLKTKLRGLRTGSKSSEETKQKQREASLRLGLRPPSWLGRKKTPEQAMKTTITLYKPCSVDGVVYPSFKHAAAALGIKPGTLRRRLFSKNFTTYILL